ncbi:hypothetical protein ACFL0V_06250 [Nanoarchaeota archaeon]
MGEATAEPICVDPYTVDTIRGTDERYLLVSDEGIDLIMHTGYPQWYTPGMFFNLMIGPDTQMMITGRELCKVRAKEKGHFLRYPSSVSHYELREGMQVVEVGAGFGAFIPKAVEAVGSPRPIVIDSMDYEQARDMLLYARENLKDDMSHSVYFRVDEMVDRWLEVYDILHDRDKVKLINKPLDQALEEEPDLEGIADVVVDFKAIRSYHRDQTPLLVSLLKEGGRLLPGGDYWRRDAIGWR